MLCRVTQSGSKKAVVPWRQDYTQAQKPPVSGASSPPPLAEPIRAKEKIFTKVNGPPHLGLKIMSKAPECRF